MEDLRDNNYGYELPNEILDLIEEFLEDEDDEHLECLDKILDECDHTDLNMLSESELVSDLIENFIDLQNDSDLLLYTLIKNKQKEYL